MKKNYILFLLIVLTMLLNAKSQTVLFEQTINTELNSGVSSIYVTNNALGNYAADDFTFTSESAIETIFIPGFYITTTGDISTIGTAVNLFIYTDLNDSPSEYPATIGGAELEIRDLDISDSSISIDDNNFTIDITAINGSPFVLPEGKYWLVFNVHVPAIGNIWSWFYGDTPNPQNGKIHDEGNYGGYLPWTNFLDIGMDSGALAFRIEGTEVANVLDNKLFKIEITPNPVKNNFNIVSNLDVKKVEIFSILGKLIYSENYTSNQIDISKLEKGVYLVNIDTENGTIVKKMIKN